MSDPADVQPPDPAPPATRNLDRAPGERYRGMGAASQPGGAAGPGPGTAAAGSTRRAILAATGMAAAGALLYAGLGQIDLGAGLLAVAAFVGWMVALVFVWGAGAARPIARGRLLAGLLGAGAIVVGLLLAWAWSRVEGGVLGPIDYTNERYGPLAYAEIVVAGVIAALRAR